MTSFQKFIVSAYRYLAVFILLAVLSTAIGYAAITVFYSANASWAAPLVISGTNDRILRLKAELFRSQEGIDSLEQTLEAIDNETRVLKEQQGVMETLIAKAKAAESFQHRQTLNWAGQLAPLQAAKKVDIARTNKVVDSLNEQERQIEQELTAGLITKAEARRSLAGLNSMRVSATDSATAGINLDKQVSELRQSASTLAGGAATSPHALEAMSQLAAYQTQLSAIQLTLAKNTVEKVSKTRQLSELKKLRTTLQESAYFRVAVSDKPISFAYVPYLNEEVAKAGNPVFDCTFQVFWCQEVGKVARVHADEEKGQHPLFKTDLRGFLVELDLNEKSAAKSRVLFIGGKPLLF